MIVCEVYVVLSCAQDCLVSVLGCIGILKLKALENMEQSFAEFSSVKHYVIL